MKIERKKVERYIEDIIGEQKKEMEKTEYEKYRDKFYQVVAMAEEGGVVMGFRYAAQLMAECMGKSIVKPE